MLAAGGETRLVGKPGKVRVKWLTGTEPMECAATRRPSRARDGWAWGTAIHDGDAAPFGRPEAEVDATIGKRFSADGEGAGN